MEKEIGIQSYERVKINFNPVIPPLTRIKDKSKIDIRYALIPPFAFAHIYWDKKKFELTYDIEEPSLDESERRYREHITTAMRDLINFDTIIEKNRDALLRYIDTRFKILATEFGMKLTYESYKKIYYYLVRDFLGMNEIEPFLRDYFV